jgi:signal transduction histidine kinase/CheY-like chemotaxis protein
MSVFSKSEERRFRFEIQQLLKALLLASIVVPALVFMLYAGFSYADAFHDAEVRARHLSALLQEHALKVFETVGLALRETDQRLKGVEWETIRTSRNLWEELRKVQMSSEQLGSIFVVDAQGRVPLTTRAFPAPEVDFSDRDYYIAQKEANAGLYLGQAYIGKISKESIFNFSIRRTVQDGSFNGVIGSSAFVDYFQQFYKSVGDPADNFSVVLMRDDGKVLVRHPAADVGAKFDVDEAFFKSISRIGQGVFYSTSPVDGVNRLYAVTKVRNFPAYVMYSVDPASILRDWYGRIAVAGGIAAAFAGILFVITSVALRRVNTEAIALEQLAEEVERRERAEASLLQAQRLDAVGRLTSGIAHDFNNLLQIILGNLELAQRRSDSTSIKRVLTSARYAAERGADLTRRLLAFSREQALNAEIIDLNLVLEKARTWLGRTISDAIEIKFSYADDLWPVRIDVAQFEAALLNLVVNARDAMPEGGGLSLQTRNIILDRAEIARRGIDVAPGEYVAISVSDTGSGISADVLARVYEPFFTTKEVGKGSGLGLSQAYGFARQSGGGISIESEVGSGTTVCLYLPRCERSSVEKGPTPDAGCCPTLNSGQIVLIVEDNDEVRRISASMMDDLGYTTITTRNGIEAMAVLSTGEPIDILFSDVFMPRGMSGVQLAQQALALRPTLKVLLTTASLDADARFPLLRKPYTKSELGKKMSDLSAIPQGEVGRPRRRL